MQVRAPPGQVSTASPAAMDLRRRPASTHIQCQLATLAVNAYDSGPTTRGLLTDVGEVRITAGAADGHFELSVSDTGLGIPLQERERIFEKFRQVDGSNTRVKGGRRLGLIGIHNAWHR